MTTPRQRYAVVGTGHRAQMYVDALLGSHADVGELVALCDPNPTRMAYYQDLHRAARPAACDLPQYPPERFADLLAEQRPDGVIVTSVDATHAEYVCASLAAGAAVICEKPLTTTARDCRRIAEAAAASTAPVVVTFNYRYSPRNSAVREVIAAGEIGEVTSVHFEWVLDTVHGADYFRRWHRDKARSGGLLVHKASHHFDLVNWWLDDEPERVVAMGGLRFYGAGAAAGRGVGGRPERSHGDPGLAEDPFGIDLAADPRLRRLYLDAEADDGYLRDRDVFAEGISIEDNMAVLVGYRRGATLSYSLNAHAPWEGYRVSVNGTAGRLELAVVERAEVHGPRAGARNAVDPSAHPDADGGERARRPGAELLVQRHWEPARRVPITEGKGAHGGGDALLLDDLFRPDRPVDPLRRTAGWRDGVRAVGVGVAANESLETGRPVDLAELLGAPV
ncbi:Gfo/Idh/MocA family oxidoreductase [Pseudonocardia humida]|uniref:Gfo/Idh/MocA family oxidoreductase n=1 Tax=Pseudonocardia humida TaxID=2800819 RepID=A0ABT0ZSM3_9PSEU|nr:Gfo/Idh/MocA family oxidoreductase [Pseudonocardia humida]MCO1653713.1 Gfo/Idh/MocA family oxidoreductase [Pseudonocardia humida]